MEARGEIEILTGLQVQKPPLSTNSGRFYRIFSPEKIVLSSVFWSDPGHFLKSQGKFFLSFLCTLFSHF